MRALDVSLPLSWMDLLKRTGAAVGAGRCFDWAASLAYCFFLALFPALLFIVSLASLLPVEHTVDRLVTMLGRVAPGDVVEIARQQFVQIALRPHGAVLTLSLVAALWSTSSGVTATVQALNEAYHVTESRPWWRVRVTAIALTLGLIVAMLVAFSLVMVGPPAAQRVADWLSLGPLFGWTWSIVRWPAAFVLIVVTIACIYHFAPDTRQELVWITPGSLAATLLWLLVSQGFKWYVSHVGNYQQTYGAIGGVMVALLWFYFTSLAILVGAEVDATIAHASAARGQAPGIPGAELSRAL